MAKTLTEQKLKKLIKKLKDAKKKKRKQKRDALISQKVTQKVIIGSNIKDKNETNAGRSFPQIQFLPQPQTQNGDTQLLRDLLLRNNLSPLTRPPISRVPNRPNYDLADQYGLDTNYNPYVGIVTAIPQPDPQVDPPPDPEDNLPYNNEIETPIPGDNLQQNFSDDQYKKSLKEEEQRREQQRKKQEKEDAKRQQRELNTLKTPPQKQGTLDRPLKDPNPPNLGQSNITDFFNSFIPSSSQKENTESSKDLFDTLPSQQKEGFIDPNEFLDSLVKEKRSGRPPGRLNNKTLEKLAQGKGKEEDV